MWKKAFDDDWRSKTETLCHDAVPRLGTVHATTSRCNSEGVCLRSATGKAETRKRLDTPFCVWLGTRCRWSIHIFWLAESNQPVPECSSRRVNEIARNGRHMGEFGSGKVHAASWPRRDNGGCARPMPSPTPHRCATLSARRSTGSMGSSHFPCQ